jgi:ABC-2 type transport system ATP-binding protein
LIEVNHLTKRYGNRCAVNDLSFKLYSGRIYGLLGPNGAGKSTTMNMITGCLSPSEGSIRINGFDLFEQPLKAKRLIGYLPELPPLYADMTVAEYLTFIAEAKGVHPERVRRQVNDAMELTDTLSVADRLIAHLSKGYGQRVGIAQALLGNPEVIILDEPTVGLDPKQIIAVRNLLRTLARRHTVVLSTHILAEVQAVCERVIIINKGKIIADERTEDIVKTIEDGYRYKVKICGPAKEVEFALRKINGIKTVEPTGERDLDSFSYIFESEKNVDVRKSVFNLCVSNHWPIIGMEPHGTDLETVFIRLVDRSDGASETKKRRK